MGKGKRPGWSLPASRALIGATWWTLTTSRKRHADAAKNTGNDWLYGWTQARRTEVGVNPDQSEEAARDTLVHEVLHAALRAQGFDQLEEAAEEAVVRALAPALVSFIRGNPELVEWVAGAEWPERGSAAR
jgi:hypothetical protein